MAVAQRNRHATMMERLNVRLIGIRHHGPGSATSVRRVLDEFAPDLVAVELPSDTAHALAAIGRADLVPPVALLAYGAAEPQRAAFCPLAAFSPEWVAAQWCTQHTTALMSDRVESSVPFVPIDLAMSRLLALHRGDVSDVAIDPVRQLAQLAGDDDPERWWDAHIEHGEPGQHLLRDAISALRPARWDDDDPNARSLDALREAAMRVALADATTSLPDGAKVAVVCGAWHLPALALPATKGDRAQLSACAKIKVVTTWAPWSHHRLTLATGYRAGVESPGWYAHRFDATQRGVDPVVSWCARVAALLRGLGSDVAPAQLIDATHHAHVLGALRDRPAPGLQEISDALACVVGDGLAITEPVRRHLIVGDELGQVPLDMAAVPLAADLTAQLKACGLRVAGTSRTIELDVRLDRDRARSVLLHRCTVLGLSLAVRLDDRRSTGTFRETWRVQWHPELAIELVEHSVDGATMADAATTAVERRLSHTNSAADLSALLAGVLPCELEAPTRRVLDRLVERTAIEPDVQLLVDVVASLIDVARYGDSRATALGSVLPLIDQLLLRALVALAPAARQRDREQADGLVARLDVLVSTMALWTQLAGHDAPHHRQWQRALHELSLDDTRVHAVITGRALRIARDGSLADDATTSTRLASMLGPGVAVERTAAVIEGFIGTGSAVLLHDRALLVMLDGWLGRLNSDEFAIALPLVRRTFSMIEAHDRRRLGELLRSPSDGQTAIDPALDPERSLRAMATVELLLGVER
jgi:Family of unknown function (DUF5682)